MLSEYDYIFPVDLVAQCPLSGRSDSRMLVVSRDSGLIEDKFVRDFPLFIRSGDCVVINNTKVLAARLFGVRCVTGGLWEGLFVGVVGGGVWRVIGKTRGKIKSGEFVELYDASGVNRVKIQFLDKVGDGSWLVKPDSSGGAFDILERIGYVPIPPYIRKGKMNVDDAKRYQTVFASELGAIAAPTAGLHFDERILNEIKLGGVEIVEVTLHVGLGTFKPVEVENLEEHKMHSEWCKLTKAAADAINNCKKKGGKIIAVGTTSVRVIESAANEAGELIPFEGETSLFIKPPYKFKNVDMLLTNFHFPKSTLLVLVYTFGGKNLIRKAYEEAINKKYRLFSYGDAMLIKN
ncbi:MAG: tRNA preQ1(34) S-adenosylmethionine ribosyltransferase-isomerase QueA [Planctomycetaceae bacterium]|jgi:S-adenosylmethionine:tRNA ribosyltransferase-isomerase|nr:tRNA preQ1(34) S-adenosylmethionine ribosyltransferase-isomerase QueA [Planctomycetaceae bacterium]